ncbi:MAG: tyrosine protein phosphatase, partial [Myxococcota bacterium]
MSCLTPPEVDVLGLHAEGSIASALGMEFLSVPIPDRELPESTVQFLQQVDPAIQAFLGGSSVVAHCRTPDSRPTVG